MNIGEGARGAGYNGRMKKTISAGLLTLAVAILFVGLGFWQLARLDQRKALNAGLESRLARTLLAVYILPGPKANANTPPLRGELALDLSEGPHLGYAITWFGLAVAVSIGFVALVRSERLK